MRGWYHDVITERHRLPLLLCFSAFIATFSVTRLITRTIRAGRGPFKDNVSASGLHVHHAVPGIILLIVGALMAVGTSARPYIEIAGVLVGVGTSLVLDEFALILHMSDVYWTEDGRVSVELVSLTVACLGFVLVGSNPFDFADTAVGQVAAGGVISALAFHLVIVGICVSKGKYELALLSIFVPFLGLVCAIRLARPESRWARRFYRRPAELERAKRRAERYDRRYGRFTNVIGGFIAAPNVLAADEEAAQARRAEEHEAREQHEHPAPSSTV